MASRGRALELVKERELKLVPGRESDVRDCQWIAHLLVLATLSLQICLEKLHTAGEARHLDQRDEPLRDKKLAQSACDRMPSGRHDVVTPRSARVFAFHLAYYVAAADSTSLQ